VKDGLADERAAALASIEALTREFDGVVAASRASNADDEHDPEGATIAFERQQVVALLEQARRRLADVEAALARRDAGDYGTCQACGRPIAAERLAARPAAGTCIDCAR
jgi:RNA polymerase-binding protein DksA